MSLDFLQSLAPLREQLQATDRAYLKLTIGDECSNPVASKVSGVPYRPQGESWPMDQRAKPMGFLAQLNFAQFPPLVGFPSAGLLQFFISTNDLFGLSFSGPSDFTLRWYDAPESAARELDHSIPQYDNQACFPIEFEEGFALTGVIDHQLITDSAGEFWDIVGNTQVLDSELDAYRELFGDDPCHQIGGWPSFTQADPRAKGTYPTLLFQLDSDQKVCWGDAGIGNFFINTDDFARRDFSKVLYNWDCF